MTKHTRAHKHTHLSTCMLIPSRQMSSYVCVCVCVSSRTWDQQLSTWAPPNTERHAKCEPCVRVVCSRGTVLPSHLPRRRRALRAARQRRRAFRRRLKRTHRARLHRRQRRRAALPHIQRRCAGTSPRDAAVSAWLRSKGCRRRRGLRRGCGRRVPVKCNVPCASGCWLLLCVVTPSEEGIKELGGCLG